MLLKRIPAYVKLAIALFTLIAMTAIGREHDNQLHTAAKNGDVVSIRLLLDKGINVDIRNMKDETPLLIATHNNQVEAARLLIEAGADVNAKDQIHDSPYLYAGARGHNEILRMTLAHGADLKSINRYGGTALIPAAERGLVDTVRILIDAGVDVNHVNNLHWTALLEAIILGNGGPRHTEIVRLLVAARADVNLADGSSVTPLQHARQRGFKAIEEILVQAGARRP
ncbi:ankyrin repeat domain-containing protein [Noviherbaspirillum saxi]|uniref:Ankyrin repeat domain-containing protein n=1 Tax=Noviherbaspirillum saxi TaxID=2320863 RepID=A0A3A3FLQ5_9BURK|nr:ankyrin repeat domain-containing protein [Noviherbaspirillum saxi]RJF92462.1 ankyrin repeat domain-containing protein [Noviherbaspirillum saxi]